MNFTDIFIRRPVLSMVVSLLLLVLGLRSFGVLPVLQFPLTQNAVVTVTTTYYGADPDLVAGFITTPLENAIAQVNGIDYMTSTSTNSNSTISVNLKLNYDPDKALTEMTAQISSVLNQLPPQTQKPVMKISIGQTIDAMYIGFSSEQMASNYITDYLLRVVQPKLQAVDGVQTAELLGSKNFALRVWMDPDKLAAYDLTATDISTALAQNDFLSGVGNTKGQMVQVNLNASTNLHSVDEFRNMAIKQQGDAIVRLKDVAKVTLGSDDYDSQVSFDGKKAVYIGIQVAPSANLLDVIAGVRKAFPDIQAQLPQGINGKIVYDSTKFVNSSIHEVIKTLLEALIVITLVVFAFLGSPRSVAIPVIAIPLSLVGTFTFMMLFGFSINLLTLLAFVLAIGLVVDDAIIVVENVNRHIEEGMKPMDAAIQAARELAGPILAMTTVLIAVFVPIGFQGGLTGALFSEFAFTLVGTVTVSAIIALTLSPMMSARLLRPHAADDKGLESRAVHAIDRRFEMLRDWYSRGLHGSLDSVPVTAVFALIVLGSIYFLYAGAKHELAPQEDQGVVITMATPAPNSTLEQRTPYMRKIYETFAGHPETDHVFQMDVPGRLIAGMVLTPWDQRSKSASDLQPVVQGELAQIAGVRAVVFQPPSLPGSRGLPIQFIIGTTDPFLRLNEVAQNFLHEAQKSGMFMFLDSDLRIDLPQATVEIDRNKAALLGLTMKDVGDALASMLGGGYVNYFSLSGRSYKVIPQVQQAYRLNTDQLLNYYIRTASGVSVPLSTVVHISNKTTPESLNHFQQLNAATIQGVAQPGVTPGEALEYLKGLADRSLPSGYSIDYGGQSRQFMQESSGFVVTFAFALIIIFLALAAQFESFRDPLIILVSVPMSIAGALVFISLGVGGASLNIYTEVGLVTLMGLISKHGILIVEFANNLQSEGRSKREAIEEAAGIRLRPILMTTAAMVLGVVPLITASGAGAVSRFDMGLVIASGISIGTLFTLFVVPAVYMLLATDRARLKVPI
ncbi:MAG: multidrug efflux protein [Zetaproteobacteria bacterium CG12_big_fil_rev_8_21_14_0_65_55_1124]|nr:MAG: multidrug efflux protein [Zetaproteobacteria bacterium CG1_02_55_237]PIS18501.1 MAG: multidrug efflux protein [Zetaproteobacteria bacterium CG08_land_8_20_14_0_20_55_17]PIW43035.1 MAG: multidrug efflux protein [Zetaproteobacteria bacterium CG12_big_fil_rev_8_21_14_0_65_55_1124]PIY52598.1 MAG: multidrug efflux protein [Zetaproteobacteria bacterium CG_4_10_14_0_8_um_filter_55_43]PIZ36841.1 MAG: multidrug efflux protein [Zetaproteobacteria bacterium CG_4_10_14_0_2_um_filter_55_20]PJB79332